MLLVAHMEATSVTGSSFSAAMNTSASSNRKLSGSVRLSPLFSEDAPMPLVLGQAQCLREYVHTTFKLEDMRTLSLKFLIFRARNVDRFPGACLKIICLFHVLIIL